MTTLTYIPTSDSDKGKWMNNFQTKIGTYATTLGISAAEVTAVQKDYTMFSYVLNTMEIYKQMMSNLSSYKALLKKSSIQQVIGAMPTLPTLPAAPAAVAGGIFNRISIMVKKIKLSLNYTEAIGNDLGIISPIQTVNVNTLQPELSITLEEGRPQIKCVKGVADAIDLHVNRNDGAGFVLIGRLTKTDFLDISNLPSGIILTEWEYKAMYVIDNVNVVAMSNVVSIVVKRLS